MNIKNNMNFSLNNLLKGILIGLTTLVIIFSNFNENESIIFSSGNTADSLDYLKFATYLGGSGDEQHHDGQDLSHVGIASDSEGNIIVVGRTESNDYPTTADSFDSSKDSGSDAVITKFSPDGSELIFSTYFGGNGDDWATDVEIDSEDNIIIIGTTGSTNLPVSENALYSSKMGTQWDIFILKLDPSGQNILYCTYFGGSLGDWGYGIGLDHDENILVTGSTYSTDIVNTHSDTYDSEVDMYITKIAQNGSEILFSRNFGGLSHDWGFEIIADNDNNVIALGGTRSGNIPVVNEFQKVDDSNFDMYLVKLTESGDTIFASPLGGTQSDIGYDISVNKDNDIILVGSTQNNEFGFECDNSEIDYQGLDDICLMTIANDSSEVLSTRVLGGLLIDDPQNFAIDDNGNVYIGGKTYSGTSYPSVESNLNFPSASGQHGFLMGINESGDIFFSTQYGGNKVDSFRSLCVVNGTTIASVGFTSSDSDLPLKNAFQDNLAGEKDMFVVVFDIENPTIERTNIPGYTTSILVVGIFISMILYSQHFKRNLKGNKEI